MVASFYPQVFFMFTLGFFQCLSQPTYCLYFTLSVRADTLPVGCFGNSAPAERLQQVMVQSTEAQLLVLQI